MTIDIRQADDFDEWDRNVRRSPAATVFHQSVALKLQATHAQATLHPYIGYKGEEPVGLLPVFEVRIGPIPAAFSPPPYLFVSYLGPVVLGGESISRRKHERRHTRFIEGCLDRMAADIDPWYGQIGTTVGYQDLRPFAWAGWEATPKHTYYVDLSGSEDELLMRFSSDARRNIRNSPETGYEIEEGDMDEAERIVEQVRRRYRSHNKAVAVPDEFVTDLMDHLPSDQIRPYVCRIDGEFAGGVITTEFGEGVNRWIGGAKPIVETDLPVNDLLDWEVMRRGRERGAGYYDLVGAGNRRVNRYKAKFNPKLRRFYRLQSGNQVTTSLVGTYRRLADSKWMSLI